MDLRLVWIVFLLPVLSIEMPVCLGGNFLERVFLEHTKTKHGLIHRKGASSFSYILLGDIIFKITLN